MILYDLTALQSYKNAPAHGGGKFAEIVLYRMIERHVTFQAFYDSSRDIKPEILEHIDKNNITLYDIKLTTFENIVKMVCNPLVFSIIPQRYQLICKTVGTIHDCREICTPSDYTRFLSHFSFQDVKEYLMQKLVPHLLYRRRVKRLNEFLDHPNFIPTTITRFTKFTICNIRNTPETLNIPIFMTPSYYQPFDGLQSLDDRKYILMVSANRFVKNPIRAIKAVDSLFDSPFLKDYKFIIVGIDGADKIKVKIRNIKQFVFLDYVSEEQLLELYQGCSCLLYPSIYEGFGMPPLEAMCYGKPVVASNFSAIPEVCGGGAIYINPFSVSDIKNKLLALLLDREYYSYYRAKALERFNEMFLLQKNDLDKYIDFVTKINYE